VPISVETGLNDCLRDRVSGPGVAELRILGAAAKPIRTRNRWAQPHAMRGRRR
jgi:hypothetical protein